MWVVIDLLCWVVALGRWSLPSKVSLEYRFDRLSLELVL